ncbi:ModD protein [Ectothiorhodospira mobilis]|uniref:ModD protein n=1 Tax=Ectothiorhodospira mobilis TaxID=195064 RepID=UPI001EE9133B|nr:ModD protein [Ectothiorhodospira mobilis]MCG5535245.1 ModD protein [Ectothiorhodospira mobilis]
MMRVLSDDDLHDLLREDAPYGDLTTRALEIPHGSAWMHFTARYAMTACGLEEAARLLELLGCSVTLRARSGDAVSADAPLLEARGPAEALLLGWKVTQTLVEWASGISTAAARITRTARMADPEAVVACTRKTVPGARALSLKAITAGGAEIHRTGLSDTLLLFPEHRHLADPQEGLTVQIRRLSTRCPERRVVVEVDSHEEALEAARGGADVIQAEKFPLEALARLAHALRDFPGVRLAAAGGIHADNAADHVHAGARILVTSAPYTAPPRDVSVRLTPGD